MADQVRVAIDQLTGEKGAKKQGLWTARFSVKEVIEKAGLKNTPDNQRYVIYVVNRWYPESKVLPGQADNGGFLEMRIRSI